MGDIANVVQLKFLSDTNENIQINVPRADASLAYPGVMDLMDAVIATDTVLTKNGKPAVSKGAVLVRTETTPIDLD